MYVPLWVLILAAVVYFLHVDALRAAYRGRCARHAQLLADAREVCDELEAVKQERDELLSACQPELTHL